MTKNMKNVKDIVEYLSNRRRELTTANKYCTDPIKGLALANSLLEIVRTQKEVYEIIKKNKL